MASWAMISFWQIGSMTTQIIKDVIHKKGGTSEKQGFTDDDVVVDAVVGSCGTIHGCDGVHGCGEEQSHPVMDSIVDNRVDTLLDIKGHVQTDITSPYDEMTGFVDQLMLDHVNPDVMINEHGVSCVVVEDVWVPLVCLNCRFFVFSDVSCGKHHWLPTRKGECNSMMVLEEK